MRKRTHEEFIKLMQNTHPNIEVLGTYVNSQTKIKCKCKIDGYEWEIKPNNLLRGHGCPVCGRKIATQKHTKTHEQFIQQLYEQNIHAKDIEVLGTYKTALTKIKCRCKKDGYVWEIRPNDLLQGHGCPICGRKKADEQHRKTHEQFIQELYKINQDIEVLETYVNTDTKIKCRCKIDGHIWEPTPNNLLNGTGCPKCRLTKLTKTHEQFIQELQQINSDIEVLGTYVTNNTKILCRCKKDGYEWEVIPNDLLRGIGCPKCGGTLKKTHEQFIQELEQINPNIQVLGTYVNDRTKIKCKCRLDGHIWEPTPATLLNGTGCPKCAGNIKKTHEQFIKELQQINQDIEVLGTYVNSQTKILCRCKIDGYEWEGIPATLLRGHGCPICGITKLTKTHEQFIEELKQINQDIEILGTYVNSQTKILCRCKIDEHEWETTPATLLSGCGCPKCNISKGEKRVAQYLDNLDIDYIYNKQYFKDLVGTGGRPLRPDFIIPSLRLWIEYDGEQHFEPKDFTGKGKEWAKKLFKQVQQNDQIKNQYAEQHNWTLIRIPYWDYDNIEQILDAVIKQKEAI